MKRKPFYKKNKHQQPRSDVKPSAHREAAPSHTPSGAKTYIEGVLQIKGTFGFVLSEDPSKGDVLVQGKSLQLAMQGDRVRAVVFPGGLRRAGAIVSVLKRARETAVGIFKRFGNQAVVVSEKSQSQIQILDMGKFSPKVGDVVMVKITRWPTQHKGAGGQLIELLGPQDAPGVDLQAVIRRFELPHQFSPAVEHEAASFGSEVSESAWKNSSRELFFDHTVFTIDGADAKDFDDAVSIEPLEHGWRLGVHIADVAHYVREGTQLDKEAYERGTSVYLVGKVIPMLPFPLSDGLCSLRPDCVRLTLSCVMDIDLHGHVKKYRVVESAIKSCKRFTYDEVEKILMGNIPTDLDSKIISSVKAMGDLYKLLRKKRFSRGSLDFDFPEPYVIPGKDGRPVDIRSRERLESHKLIEEFMLLANETVARSMGEHPFLFRVHDIPDKARLEKLRKSLEAIGVPIPKHVDVTRPAGLSAILTAAEKSPMQPMVHLLILRSLKQAQYSPENKGHYGLASECYTHFTSPIRRYPDLIVHRLLKEKIHGSLRTDLWRKDLAAHCVHTSKRERVAEEAEREFLDIQKVRLMEPYVGEEFTGAVSSVTNFGFFVQLDRFFVEGLVHVTSLGNDYYIFNEDRLTLTGRRTGRLFALGTKVKVQLVSVNIDKHQLDFKLLNDEPSHPRHKKKFRHRR